MANLVGRQRAGSNVGSDIASVDHLPLEVLASVANVEGRAFEYMGGVEEEVQANTQG